MKQNEKGFSTVEVLLLLIIVGLISFVGWYVWQSKKNADKNLAVTSSVTPNTLKAKASSVQKRSPQTYANWASYCNKAGWCFKYPADWTPVTSGPAGPEPGDFINPQKTLKLVSGSGNSPEDGFTSPAPWFTNRIESLVNASDAYKVWGGYLIGKGVNVPQYAVVDAAKVGKDGLVVGYTKSTTDTTYTTFTVHGGTQHNWLDVFGLSEGGVTKTKADAWFNTDDAETALEIVQSLYFK